MNFLPFQRYTFIIICRQIVKLNRRLYIFSSLIFSLSMLPYYVEQYAMRLLLVVVFRLFIIVSCPLPLPPLLWLLFLLFCYTYKFHSIFSMKSHKSLIYVVLLCMHRFSIWFDMKKGLNYISWVTYNNLVLSTSKHEGIEKPQIQAIYSSRSY